MIWGGVCYGQDGLLLFPIVLGLWHSYCSVRKMSWVADPIWQSFVFLVADAVGGSPTMAARRRQQGHKHGRRVLQLPRSWKDWTTAREAQGDMGAERASRGVLAPTMATERPRQLCANFWVSTFLWYLVNGDDFLQQRSSDWTTEACCQTEVSSCVLFMQM